MTRDFFSNGIPQHEAAEYFYRIKHAGWTDAPDETGSLEGQFAVPIEQVVLAVSEAASAKFKLMVAYHVYAESMRGVAQHACAEVFHEHAEHERAAAEAYLKRAAVLGSGAVHLPEIETPPASSDPVGILMALARAEQEAIELQARLRDMVGDVNPIRFQIEQFMVEDQHHLDELWQMLPQDVARTPVIDQAPAGAQPVEPVVPEEAEQPEVSAAAPKKEASGLMSFRRSLRGVADAGSEAAQEGAGVWSKLQGAPTVGRSAATGGGLGVLGGAAIGATEAASPVDMKQEALEGAGPIERFQHRHPIATNMARMGAIGAGIGASGHKVTELMLGTRGNPRMSDAAKAALPSIIPGAAGMGLAAADNHLHEKELREIAKGASAVDHIKNLGRKMRDGASRYGELLTGSKANSLAHEARIADLDAKSRLRAGVRGGRGMAPEAKKRFGQKAMDAMDQARKAGDAAIAEHTKSRATQVATGAGVVGVSAAVAGRKHKKDMEKIDRTNARLKQAFVRGLQKLALSSPEPGLGTDPAAAPIPDNQPMMVPQASMEAPGVQPPMATPPGAGSYAPVNYLEAEETARRVQEANEAAFYRGKAEEAGAQVQSMGAQFADVQAQLDQLKAQAAESQSQIMAANEEALRANDQMLNQATLAARMRMGMQQLRAQMMEIASQDPEQLAAAAGGPTPMDVGMQAQQAAAGPAPAAGGAPPGADPSMDPGAQPGAPGASPDPNTAPGSAPAAAGGPSDSGSPSEAGKSDGGGTDKEKKESGGETTVSIKKGSAKTAGIYEESVRKLPFAAAGAAIGAGAGYLSARRGANIPNLRQKVDELKGQQTEGGFGKAIELGRAQIALAEAEEGRQDPTRAALRGGLLGASIGSGLSVAVPAIHSGGKELYKNLRTAVDVARQGA